MPVDPDRLTKDIGRRIAELRTERRLTQEEFGVLLGSTFQWVAQIEGGRNLTIHTMAKIANALKVGVADLFIEPRPDDGIVRRGRPRKNP